MIVLLASQSPRRKELLAGLGIDFEVVSVNVDEVFPDDLPVEKVPAYLSELKASAYSGLKQNEILITADTVVISNGKILGKPKDEQEAIGMLLQLSDQRHSVVTAVTITTQTSSETFSDETEVELDTISLAEAQYYVSHYRPLDKAGAYGVQEWLGMAKIRGIHGSFYTVMGLPTHLIYQSLSRILSLGENP